MCSTEHKDGIRSSQSESIPHPAHLCNITSHVNSCTYVCSYYMQFFLCRYSVNIYVKYGHHAKLVYNNDYWLVMRIILCSRAASGQDIGMASSWRLKNPYTQSRWLLLLCIKSTCVPEQPLDKVMHTDAILMLQLSVEISNNAPCVPEQPLDKVVLKAVTADMININSPSLIDGDVTVREF